MLFFPFLISQHLCLLHKKVEQCRGVFSEHQVGCLQWCGSLFRGGKLNVSAEELGCEALVVSNFTLYGDTKKGKRPSFIAAAKPPLSVEAYEAFVAELRKTGLARVETGEFGADMKVTLTNDGPVTIVIDTDEWKR